MSTFVRLCRMDVLSFESLIKRMGEYDGRRRTRAVSLPETKSIWCEDVSYSDFAPRETKDTKVRRLTVGGDIEE